MTTHTSPHLNLESFKSMRFRYNVDDDIAVVHIDDPRPAITVEVDDGWYLRVAEQEVVGMELHGLQRIFLSSSYYSRVFAPALDELSERAGQPILKITDATTVSGTVEELPQTMHLLIFMIGQATMKYQEDRREEFIDAGKALLTS
jgi:hypothetical protein